jgi:hypothetical protein
MGYYHNTRPDTKVQDLNSSERLLEFLLQAGANYNSLLEPSSIELLAEEIATELLI